MAFTCVGKRESLGQREPFFVSAEKGKRRRNGGGMPQPDFGRRGQSAERDAHADTF